MSAATVTSTAEFPCSVTPTDAVRCGLPLATLFHVVDSAPPLPQGIGPLHLPISTVEPKAQRHFNQALTLAFGFNHAESVRSFRATAALDPTCGICYAGMHPRSGRAEHQTDLRSLHSSIGILSSSQIVRPEC